MYARRLEYIRCIYTRAHAAAIRPYVPGYVVVCAAVCAAVCARDGGGGGGRGGRDEGRLEKVEGRKGQHVTRVLP